MFDRRCVCVECGRARWAPDWAAPRDGPEHARCGDSDGNGDCDGDGDSSRSHSPGSEQGVIKRTTWA